MDATDKIAAWLEQEGLTASELARRAGVDRKRISDIKRDVYSLNNWKVIKAIATEMGVPADYLMDPAADWPPAKSFEGRVLSRHEERVLDLAALLPAHWVEGRLVGNFAADDPLSRAMGPAPAPQPGEGGGGYARPLGTSDRGSRPPGSEDPKGKDLTRGRRSR